MKEIINKTVRMMILDLNSFSESGLRKSIHIPPKSSIVIEDSEALSRQVIKAESVGAIEIKDAKEAKKAFEAKEEKVQEEPKQEETKKLKKFTKEDKTNNKEDK